MSLSLLSKRLKELRLSQNMTLQDVASRAGTSIAAVHRYENHWDRFELHTLEKLASVLGAEVQFTLKSRKSPKPISLNNAYSILKPLFWDVTIKRAALKTHLDWLTVRVLEYGTLQQVKAFLRFFSQDKIAESFFRQTNKFSAKTLSTWQAYFQSRNPSCISKSYPKELVPFLNR